VAFGAVDKGTRLELPIVRPGNEGHAAAINDARAALSQTDAKEAILAAFTEWWRHPNNEASDNAEGGISRPPTEQLAERLSAVGRDDLAAFALGPWIKQGPLDPTTWQFAIILGESFVKAFVAALLAGNWRATNFFGLGTFGAWEAFDLALRGVLRADLSATEAAIERLRGSVEGAKRDPTGSMPHDDRLGAQVSERVRRYVTLPEIDEAWQQSFDVPVWADYSFLWDVLLDVRPTETMALIGQMPHPLLMRSCFGRQRLAERPEEVARLIAAAPSAFADATFQASGAVSVLLLEIAWTAIETTAHKPDGSLLLIPIDRPELLVPVSEKCSAVTEIILDALFSRPDSVSLAWAWLERMVSDFRLQGVPSVTEMSLRLNLPALAIVSLAKRLHWRADYQDWVNQRAALWRIYRLSAVVAVETFGHASDASRIASILEWALIKGDLAYAAVGTAMGDAGDVVAMIGGQAISTFPDPAVWFADIWQKLRPIRERNWRVGLRGGERNIAGELCALWGLAALESQSSTHRKKLWANIENAARDAWQTDSFGYAPNWSTALLRLFQLFAPDTGEGCATREQQLSRVLCPYIGANYGFMSLVIDLTEHGWSIAEIRNAVAMAGFDLRNLVTEFLDMKERAFSLPQAKNDLRIAKFRKLAEALQLFKCIYCLGERDRLSYTKVEHVLPQSFGKFEQNFTLQCVVCDACNEYFGNNLEIHLGRDTYEGQLRFTHGVKDASDFKPTGRQSRIVLKLAEGPFAGCFVNRRFSREKGEIEVTPLPQVGFLLAPTDHYEYFLLANIPSLAELQEKGFNGDRPRTIRGVAVDPEVLTQFLGERGIPFRFAGYDDSRSDRPETILCEFEGTIDQVIRRAIAKIAFNYLARWQGPEFLRLPEFDMARRYIRYGTLPDYEMMRVDEEAILDGEPLEGPRALGHIVTAGWTNVHSVLAQVALFNWLSYRISLTKEFPHPRPEIRRGHIFDVTNRKIHELGSSIKALC
jgi:hypothetical protein